MTPLAIIPLLLLSDGSGEWSALQTKYRCAKKETPASCASRLRDALKAELARPTLAPSLKSGCARGAQTATCAPPVDGCTPLAAFIADKLSLVGPAAAIALPELEAAEKRMPEHRALILRARAAARSPEVLDAAKALLASDCIAEGAQLLSALGTAEAAAALIERAHADPFEGRATAIGALRSIQPDMPSALLPMLAVDQPSAVLHALIGWVATKDAVPALIALAENHAVLRIREEAARVATKLGGVIVSPSPQLCANPDPRVFAPPPARTPAAVCPVIPAAKDLVFEHGVDGVCLQAGHGAGGAELSANGVAFFRTPDASPVQLVALRGKHYVLRSQRHPSFNAAEIDLLVQDPRGWRLAFVAELPGALRGSTVDAQGRLVLHTDEPHCPSGTRVRFTPGLPGLEQIR